MKLHATPNSYYNTFTAYGPGYVEINETRHAKSILVMPEGPITPWPVTSFARLALEDFEALALLQPELVVLGTGSILRFVHPRLIAPLTERRIGVECMDLHAACRTYNILMSEGRRVAAALLIESAPDSA